MFKTNLTDASDTHKITDRLGVFSVIEYEKDISISPSEAETAYFASKMNIRKKQLIANLSENRGVVVQAGSMQMMLGNVVVDTNVTGAGDLMKKFVGSKVTGESTIKPRYVGEGMIVLEPTFMYIVLANLNDWGQSMIIEDGMFLACEDSVDMKITSRTNVSSAVLGREGLFNTLLFGEGVVALESPVPAEELIVVDLTDDTIKIDGNMAIAWSSTLEFSVERTTKTLIGSAASGEGFVNVFRGTGRILIAPIAENRGIDVPKVNH